MNIMKMKINFKLSRYLILLSVAALTIIIYAAPNKPRVHLIGDSTMADKPLDDNPERGWGQLFPLYFTQEIQII
ncbi:MAG TPA: hypothetical protein PKV04_01930, partial [Candidatus Marinimicrobia bacterium]|nr:hypothetical protein [Candidatus Neomarinimicrobiota bacterium]